MKRFFAVTVAGGAVVLGCTTAAHAQAVTPARVQRSGAAIVGSSAVPLAANCSGRTCALKDPKAEGCTATSITQARYTSGNASATIDNEYSSACNANWVVAYESSAAQAAGWSIQIDVTTTDSLGRYEETCMPDPYAVVSNSTEYSELCQGTYGGATGWPTWTDMVDGTNKTYADLAVYTANGYLGGAEADQ